MKDLGIWTLEATSVAVGQIAASLRDTVTVGTATQNRMKPEVIEDFTVRRALLGGVTPKQVQNYGHRQA
jgi:hypothetical protein